MQPRTCSVCGFVAGIFLFRYAAILDMFVPLAAEALCLVVVHRHLFVIYITTDIKNVTCNSYEHVWAYDLSVPE
jgi:hypothetical protein